MFELIINILLFIFLGFTFFTHVLEAAVPASVARNPYALQPDVWPKTIIILLEICLIVNIIKIIKKNKGNPDFTLGWTNAFSWKGLELSLLVDGRYGGKVLSQTQADMDMYGVTKVTGDARDRGYVILEGEKITNVKGFYKSIVGGRAGVTEYYMYDATNFRLRELALGYTFPKRWMEATKFFRDVQLAFTARNLFFIYKEAPFDPDLILSTGNDNQAIEVYGMPTTRSMGFSLRVMF